MKIVYCRYHDDYPACLPTAVQNFTQMPGLSIHEYFGSVLGRHPNNEHDVDENSDVTNAMALLVITGHILGVNGHYVAGDSQLSMFGRVIEPMEPVFRIFEPTADVDGVHDGAQLMNMITGPNPNQYMLVRFILTFIADVDGDEPTEVGHYGSIAFAEGTQWWFGHGTRLSKPRPIQQGNLRNLLFTTAGRDTLAAVVQADFGGRATVAYHPDMFLALPKIQLVGPQIWEGIPNAEIKRLPVQFVSNGNTTTINKMHNYEIMELNDMEPLDDLLAQNIAQREGGN